MSHEQDSMKELIDSVMQDQSIVEDFNELLFSDVPSLEKEARQHPLYLAVKLGLESGIYEEITHDGETFRTAADWDTGVMAIIDDYAEEVQQSPAFDDRKRSLVISKIEDGGYGVAVWHQGMSGAIHEYPTLQLAVESMHYAIPNIEHITMQAAAVPENLMVRVGYLHDGSISGWVHQDISGDEREFSMERDGATLLGVGVMIDNHLLESRSYQQDEELSL